MKRIILTLAAVLLCAVAFGQKKVIAESGLNSLYTFEGSPSYCLTLHDDLGGGFVNIIFLATPNQIAGFFGILEGVLSGKYPDGIGISQGRGFASFLIDKTNNVLLVSDDGKIASIDAALLAKFKAAIAPKK